MSNRMNQSYIRSKFPKSGIDLWDYFNVKRSFNLQESVQRSSISHRHITPINSTVTKAANLVNVDPTDVLFAPSKSSDTNNNGSEDLRKRSSSTLRQGPSWKSFTLVENDGRELPGFGSFPSVKAVYTTVPIPFRASTAPSSSQSVFSKSYPKIKSRTRIPSVPKNYSQSRERLNSTATTPSNIPKFGLRENLKSQTIKDMKIVLPRRGKSPTSLRRNSIPRTNKISVPGTSRMNRVSNNVETARPQTAPTRENSQSKNCNLSISLSEEMLGQGCLKKYDEERDGRSSSRPSRHGVTFAPDTLNIQRENKPKKIRMKNNRKPKFAHPCCGHFLPPLVETIKFCGPDSIFSDNPYTKFTTIWCGPMGRVSSESVSKKNMRQKRFRSLLSSLSVSHEAFNGIPEERKATFMTQDILPLYISALDIALMDGEMAHVEQLLTTIISSLRILQINLHDVFFEKNGDPKPIGQIPSGRDDFYVNLGPVIFAINRIAGDQYSPRDLPIESHLVKLQLELLALTISPWDCLIFRSQLALVPTTASRGLELLQQLREMRSYYCIRWVNDSVMHRDYMGLLKFFGFCDHFGAKNPVPLATSRGQGTMITDFSSSDATQRPVSADF